MRASYVAAGSVAVPGVAAALSALGRYTGSPLVFLFFNLCFIALAIAAIMPPRLYVHTMLAAFLVMGLWAKTMVHTLWRLDFLEPVGDFGNSPAEWDRALLAMSAAAVGVLAARCAHLVYRRRISAGTRGGAAPRWFVAYRNSIWAATAVAIIAVNAANLHFAFFQIGVDAKWLLPLRLHILLAWLVNIGFALWVAALIWWDYQRSRTTLRWTLVFPFLESFLSSVSAFSRIAYLVHGASYWLALFERRKELKDAVTARGIAIVAACFVLLILASILAVFWLRASYYPANADLGRNLKLEIPQLIVQRWVGLEGVLAVGAVPDRGPRLLLAAIADSPKAGTDSLYQRVAKTRYTAGGTGPFTFLTNAGPVAILSFSGSAVVVCLGMVLLTLVLILTEEIAARWTGNPFLLAVGGAAMANVLSQTTFFYLTLVFFLQMCVALAFLAALARLPLDPAARPDGGAER